MSKSSHDEWAAELDREWDIFISKIERSKRSVNRIELNLNASGFSEDHQADTPE